MRVLITGYAGFIGRRFVLKLLESDDNEIVGVDNMYSGLPAIFGTCSHDILID